MNVKDIKNLEYFSAFHGEFATYRTKDKKEGIINRQGEIVLPAEKYAFVDHHSDDIFELWLENADGVIRCSKHFDAKLGRELPAPEREKYQSPELPENAKKYKEARWCASNRIVFKEGELYGFMDENGKVIVPPTYTAGPFSSKSPKDRLRVQKDGMHGFIDLDGNVVIPFEHPFVSYSEKLGIHTFHTKEDEWGIMDKKGQIIIPAEFDHMSISEDRGLDEIAVTKDGRCYFINSKQEEVKVF